MASSLFLDTRLRPTRAQVLSLDYRQDTITNEWFWPKVPHGTNELLDANRKTVSEFVQQLTWSEAPGDSRRTADQVHLMAEDVPLRCVYEELLIPLRLTVERDSQLFTGLLLQIRAYLDEHDDTLCSLYRMSKGKSRVRSVNDNDEIPTLFQGANYADAAHKDMVYPGDDKERAAQGVTIQLHTLQVRQKGQGEIIADDVPTVAVWIPQSMAEDWLVQERG